MAVDYAAIFARLGKIVKERNLWTGRQSSLALGSGVGSDEILDQFNDDREAANGVLDLYLRLAGAMRGHVVSLDSIAGRFLVGALRDELKVNASDPASVLWALRERMIADSATIKANAVSDPVAAIVAGSVGNGAVSVSKLGPFGITDERAVSDVIRLRCDQDLYSGSTTAFLSDGGPIPAPGSDDPRRAGRGPRILVSNHLNLVANGNFTSWGTNVPTGWTVGAGTAGTNIFKNDAILWVNPHSLELKSNGVASAIRVNSEVSVAPRTVYCLSFVARRSSGLTTAGANFNVSLKTDGSGTVNAFSASPTTLSTSFTRYSVFFVVADAMPQDFRIEVQWSSATGNSGESIYVGEVTLVKAPVHNHTAIVVHRGTTNWKVGDEITVTTANDYGGLFQTFLGRAFGIQLPSSGSPSINDSLAA